METLNEVVLPYAGWQPTKETIHRYLQIVGKLRLAVLRGISVSEFHDSLIHAMRAVGADPSPIVLSRPFDLPDSDRPFRFDDEHRSYDPSAAATYGRVLADVNILLEEFCGRYSGKTSPVHHFWHTFDIAATRFSDSIVEHGSGVDPSRARPIRAGRTGGLEAASTSQCSRSPLPSARATSEQLSWSSGRSPTVPVRCSRTGMSIGCPALTGSLIRCRSRPRPPRSPHSRHRGAEPWS